MGTTCAIFQRILNIVTQKGVVLFQQLQSPETKREEEKSVLTLPPQNHIEADFLQGIAFNLYIN